MNKLNKYIFLLAIYALSFCNITAQDAPNRTTNTIIADALVQLPARNEKAFNQTIASLVDTGEDGLLKLIQMMKNPGEKSNESIEFAISGWTNFVAKDEAKRIVAANAYEKALKLPVDNQIKAFVIRQLEYIGNDDQVDGLVEYLTHEKLSSPAVQALATINTPKANSELLLCLKKQTNLSEKIQINLITALGNNGINESESELLKLLQNQPSAILLEVLYPAVAKVGTKNSILPLKNASELADYSYQKNGATASYVAILNRLVDKNSKVVQKNANLLLNKATKLNKQDLRIAAMNILMKVPGRDRNKLLKIALKDKNKIFVANTLVAYTPYANSKGIKMAVKKLESESSSDATTSIIYWLGNQKEESAINAIIRCLNSSEKSVQIAAIKSLAKTGSKESVKALINLFKNENTDLISLVKNALLTVSNDNLSNDLALIFQESSDPGKKAILEIIELRQWKSQYQLVYNQIINSNNITVKTQALKSLKSVVTDKNIPDIFQFLEKEDVQMMPALQSALNVALSFLSKEEQFKLITKRMQETGKNYLYYNALAAAGTIDAKNKILSDYNSLSGLDKSAAFEALTNWKSFDAVYSLLEIARKSNDKIELGKATDAVISLIEKSNKNGEVKALYLREIMQYTQSDTQRNAIIKQMGNTNSYKALLYVAQFINQPALKEAATTASMNLLLNNSSFYDETTVSILNEVIKALNNPDAGYQREAIKKFIEENKKQNGFVSIFNGKDLTGWKGLVGNPLIREKMSKKELDKQQKKADVETKNSWLVNDGELIFTGKGNNLCTDKQYADFEMLIDCKLYPGNESEAGICLRGTPKVQIWDTARVSVGANVGSGGLHNNIVNSNTPLMVADEKVGEWNHFRIKMIGDRVTIWLNGELVVNNTILENSWDRNQPIPFKEQIELQAGSKVAYRDILIREIISPEPFKLSKEEVKEGFKILFDGANMHQWIGNTTDYIIEDGNIVVYPTEQKVVSNRNLYTKDQFGNFVFRFEFQLTPGANNGLGIRTPMEGDAAYVGMELQILDNDAPVYEKLQKYQYHGSVYGIIPAKRGFLKPVGEWNYQEVIANGDNIKVILNGELITDGNIRDAVKNGTPDKKQHPGLFNEKGHIGFLGHGSVVRFRNIRIKEIKD